jgi:serine/threonine protein kinase
MTTSSEWIGKKLGPYRIVEDLQSRGMTTVLKAIDETSGETVALKVLPAEVGRSSEYIRRFRREYSIMAELSHPNLMPIREYMAEDGYHFFSMPFISDPTLDTLLAPTNGRCTILPFPRLARIGIELLRALEYIHGLGLIHRDLKPVNIFVRPDDGILLADFGLVKAIRRTVITVTPTFLGTMAYASPEQIDVSAEVDQRSDLYQTGLILLQAAAGALPFPERDIEAMINIKCFSEGLASARSLNPDVPAALDAFITRSTKTEREKRFASATEMRQALEEIATGLGLDKGAVQP